MVDALPTKVVPKNMGRVRRASRQLGNLANYCLLGILASLVAGVTGTILLFALAPSMSFYAAAFVLFPFTFLVIYKLVTTWMLLTSPLAFLCFPIAAQLMGNSLARDFALPTIGALGGSAILYVWITIEGKDLFISGGFIVFLGAIPGFASGIFYALGLREIGK